MEPEERDAGTPAGREVRRGASVPQDRWFSGHRHAERHRVRFPVELRGANLTMHGIALDLSATGLLVGVPVAALVGKTSRANLLGVYVTLHHTCDDGVAVEIPGHGAIGRARIARIVDGAAENAEVLLGLRLEQPLSTEFVERWGSRPDDRA